MKIKFKKKKTKKKKTTATCQTTDMQRKKKIYQIQRNIATGDLRAHMESKFGLKSVEPTVLSLHHTNMN